MMWMKYNRVVTEYDFMNVEDVTKAFDNFEQLKAAGDEWQELDTVTLEWALCRADDMAYYAGMYKDERVRTQELKEIRDMFWPVRKEVRRRNAGRYRNGVWCCNA